MQIQKQEETKIFVGQNLDVLDNYNHWMNGEVLGIENNQAYIHYSRWHPKYDQLVQIGSNRILKQWQPKNKIQLNNRLDVYHSIGGWLEARVIQLKQANQNCEINEVKVHFYNYHPKYDMWVNLKDKNQVTIIGQKSKAYGMGRRKRKSNSQKSVSEIYRELLKRKLFKMIKQLDQHNFVMKEIGGDGNCLFRSISDQLYGQETFHNQIRQLCMKYILQQKEFFQNFLAQDIDEYVQRKSQSGAWGDDIEIQALSEIYARPIEIYAMGIKPIRTFHEDNQSNIEPLRLAYIGQCHYNSIKKKSVQNLGLIPSRFGQFQLSFWSIYLEHKSSQIYWTNRNRDKFSHFNPLQETIEQRIIAEATIKNESQELQKDLMQQTIQMSQNQQLSKQIQDAQLKHLQKRLQQEAIQKQLKRLQEQQLQQVKKLSAINSSVQNNRKQRPYWFDDILNMGFSEQQVWFAIEIKGYNPEGVQNFLLDNM